MIIHPFLITCHSLSHGLAQPSQRVCNYLNAFPEFGFDRFPVFWEIQSKACRIFFISGMIEAWGRGFDKIRTACDSLYSTPMPEYDISDEGIMVFCKPNEKYLLLLKKDRLGIDESILSRFRSDEASSILQIMELIVANGSINNAEARETTGKSKPTITRLLSKMCTVGLIISEGSGPAVRYKKSAQIS